MFSSCSQSLSNAIISLLIKTSDRFSHLRRDLLKLGPAAEFDQTKPLGGAVVSKLLPFQEGGHCFSWGTLWALGMCYTFAVISASPCVLVFVLKCSELLVLWSQRFIGANYVWSPQFATGRIQSTDHCLYIKMDDMTAPKNEAIAYRSWLVGHKPPLLHVCRWDMDQTKKSRTHWILFS